MSLYTNAIISVGLHLSISPKTFKNKNCHPRVVALEIFDLRAKVAHSNNLYHQGIIVDFLMARCLIKLTVFLCHG